MKTVFTNISIFQCSQNKYQIQLLFMISIIFYYYYNRYNK